MSRGTSMDAISLDDWELLPDPKSSFFMEECGNAHGTVGGKDQLLLGAKLVMINMDHFGPASQSPPYDCVLDEETKRSLLPPLQDAYEHDLVTEFKDIGVVQAEPKREETIIPMVTEILISDAEEEEEEMIKCPSSIKDIDQAEVLVEATPNDECAEEEEGIKKIGFNVGNLRVHGVGALCSFGVAAATFCIVLLGGK